MMYKSSLSLRGQITIPKFLRDKFQLKPGDEVLISEAGGRIVITPKLPDPVSQGRGFLAKRLPGVASWYDDDLKEPVTGGSGPDGISPGVVDRGEGGERAGRGENCAGRL